MEADGSNIAAFELCDTDLEHYLKDKNNTVTVHRVGCTRRQGQDLILIPNLHHCGSWHGFAAGRVVVSALKRAQVCHGARRAPVR